MAKQKPIEELFGQALEIRSAVERQEFLLRACADDAELRQEIATLLLAHEKAGTFLAESENGGAAAPPCQAGTAPEAHGLGVAVPRITGFRLERKLGEGGLGTVYEAWDEKLHRKVALKILRPVFGSETQRALLEEARKAAAIDDPAIVTIHAVLD